MFANPLWSVLILAGLVGVYIVIRIKHGKPLIEAFNHLEGFDWLKAFVIRFRSWVATAVAALLIAAPDLLVALAPVDLSPFIGEKWASIVTGSLAAFLALNRAFSTKPDGQQA